MSDTDYWPCWLNSQDCEVQDGVIVEEETDTKSEQFMNFEGLEHGMGGMTEDEEDEEARP